MSSPVVSADPADRSFYEAFVSGALHPRDFRHREHLRLAYLCLSVEPHETALITFKRLLREFLKRHQIDPSKYHETLTCAWLQAVNLHMSRTPDTASFADFIAQHSALLDANLMFTHYTRERLISTTAREQFVTPDLQPIPHYAG